MARVIAYEMWTIPSLEIEKSMYDFVVFFLPLSLPLPLSLSLSNQEIKEISAILRHVVDTSFHVLIR